MVKKSTKTAKERLIFQDDEGNFYSIDRKRLEELKLSSDEVETIFRSRETNDEISRVVPTPPSYVVRATPSSVVRATPSSVVRATPSSVVRATPFQSSFARATPSSVVRAVPPLSNRLRLSPFWIND